MRLTAGRISFLIVGLATVATLVVSATLLRVPTADIPPSEVMVHSLANRFFDAANDFRTHESHDPFIGVITEDFSLHMHNSNTTLGRQDFLDLLSGWHATFPGFHFVQHDIASEDSLAIVRYELSGTTGELAGLSATAIGDSKGRVALLRIEKGKVAEAWGLPALGRVRQLLDDPVENVGGRKLIGIARITYAAGASAPREVVPGTLLIVPMQGAIDVRVDGTFESASEPGSVMRAVPATGTASELRIGPGEMMILSAFTWHQLSNTGNTPTTLLIAGVFPATSISWSTTGHPPALSSITPSWPVSRSEGVMVQPLIGRTANAPTLDETVVQIDRVTLGPDHGLEMRAESGTLLLLIEQGSVNFEINGPNSAVVTGASGDPESIPFADSLSVNDGLMVTIDEPNQSVQQGSESSGTISIINDGAKTAVILVLTVLHPEIT